MLERKTITKATVIVTVNALKLIQNWSSLLTEDEEKSIEKSIEIVEEIRHRRAEFIKKNRRRERREREEFNRDRALFLEIEALQNDL